MAARSGEQAIEALVEMIYDAALAPERWPEAVATLTRAVGGVASGLLLHDGRSDGGDLFVAEGYSARTVETYQREFATGDGRQRELTRAAVGQVLADGHDLDLSTYRRTRIYNEFFAPLGLEHGLGVSLFSEAGRVGVLSMLRPSGSGAFTVEQVRMVQCLVPHLRRALQVHGRLAGAAALGAGLASVLDHMPMAVFLVERNGRIVLMNEVAERMARRPSSPLAIRHGCLTAPEAEAKLRGAIEAAGSGAPPPPVLHIRTAVGTAVGVMVAPVRPDRQAGLPTHPLVLVFVSGGMEAPDSILLVHQFGLSPAEAAVAASLAQGQGIEDVAQRRGVSLGTVRAQVKAILAKTHTHSQHEVVALIARSLASLHRPG